MIYSPSILSLVQTRFPRSKKKRIRAKWAKRDENFELRPGMYQMDNEIFVHPNLRSVVEGVTEAIPKVNPMLGLLFGIASSMMPPLDQLAEVSDAEFAQRLEAQTFKQLPGLQ